VEPVDVLIVGAGASGAALAWSLAETRMRILCLEQGDWVRTDEFPSNGRDWEERQYGDFSISPNRRCLSADYPIREDDSPIKVANYNAVGGGTILYAAHFPRMHPSDFRVKTLDGVADDWPISYKTLEPYYALNDKMMGVASLSGDPAYPPKASVLPPVSMGRTGRLFAKAMNHLGWHWWPSDAAIATVNYEGRAACIHLGHCIAGCSQGAKASTDLTYWPHALRQRVSLRTRCRVREIRTNKKGMATGVVYYDESGREQFQAAEIVVMACNGIGTPRLLLNSTSGRFPQGLANSSGLVGKRLMFHPYALARGYFDEPLDGYRGSHVGAWSQEFYETDRSRGFVRGFTWQLGRGQGPVQTAMSAMRWGKIPWGSGHHEAFRRIFDRSAGMLAICEDLPELHNRVELDPDLKDAHGIPAPRIHYRLSENSQRMLDFAQSRAKEVLKVAGARDIVTESPLSYAGWHLMGTARMGEDPQESVVNPWGRAHDVRNLFIVDASVFVTSGGVNPTATIQAIALYIADQIKQRLTHLFDD
jgi:choline dehydrogenase-like flavoprotein